jgi:hypothetical protein
MRDDSGRVRRALTLASIVVCVPVFLGACGTTGGSSAWDRGVSRGIRLEPPKRHPQEVLGVDPRVSDRWLIVGSGVPGNTDTSVPDVLRIYRRENGAWVYDATTASPDTQASDGFGFAAAASGEVIAVGAPTRHVGGVEAAGSVFIIRRGAEGWRHEASITPSTPVVNGFFGHHLAFDGTTLVVGEAVGGHMSGGAENRAVYVYARDGASWTLDATIPTPSELLTRSYEPGFTHEFGSHVTLDKGRIAVTAMGDNAVYLYERRDGAWMQTQRIEGPRDAGDSRFGPGFGRTADLSGDTLVVAALRAGGPVPDAGAAFVYRHDGSSWRLEQKLTAPDARTLDMFGHWVAADKDTVLAAAFRAEGTPGKETGAAYVFRRRAGVWALAAKLEPDTADGERPRFVGYGADLAGGTAVLSAGTEDGPGFGHHVWVFEGEG